MQHWMQHDWQDPTFWFCQFVLDIIFFLFWSRYRLLVLRLDGWGPNFIHKWTCPSSYSTIFIVIFINALVDLGFHFLDTNVPDTPHVISHHLNHSNHHDYCTLSKYSCDSLPSFFPTPPSRRMGHCMHCTPSTYACLLRVGFRPLIFHSLLI